MNCPKCGAPLPDENTRCPQCGCDADDANSTAANRENPAKPSSNRSRVLRAAILIVLCAALLFNVIHILTALRKGEEVSFTSLLFGDLFDGKTADPSSDEVTGADEFATPSESDLSRFQEILSAARSQRRGEILEDVDGDRAQLPICLDRVELTSDGELLLTCTDELAEHNGVSVIYTNVLDFALFEVGGVGFRTLVYHTESGALRALDPYALTVEHRLDTVELFPAEAMITGIEQREEDGEYVLYATALDKKEYRINDLFNRVG